MKKDSRLERAGVAGFNKPKATPSHPKKSHIVVAKEGEKVKTLRFGQQGVKTNQTARAEGGVQVSPCQEHCEGQDESCVLGR
jgi:hypothetical protein